MTLDELSLGEGPTNVLIVEDLDDTRAWLKSIVEETFPSASITMSPTLRDALDQISAQSFDLLMVDLGLPDGSGIDIIRKARAMSDEAYIVVTTIYDDEDHLISSLRAGASGYLLKDEQRDKLIEHLSGITKSRRPISDRALDQVLGHFEKQNQDLVSLTTREEEVLQLVAKGYNANESAEMLGLTPNTVKSYLKAVYGKLEISSRAEATAEAIKRQLIKV